MQLSSAGPGLSLSGSAREPLDLCRHVATCKVLRIRTSTRLSLGNRSSIVAGPASLENLLFSLHLRDSELIHIYPLEASQVLKDVPVLPITAVPGP